MALSLKMFGAGALTGAGAVLSLGYRHFGLAVLLLLLVAALLATSVSRKKML